MAKTNIVFNNEDYSIDEASLSAAKTALKNHFQNTMKGSGAKITFDGVSYDIDSNALNTATDNFTAHLGTVSGSGYTIKVGNTEYHVDSTKMGDAVTQLEAVFGAFESGVGGEDGGENGGSDGVGYGEIILEGQQLDFNYNDGMGLYFNHSTTFELIVGQEYVVVWDGVEYKSVCSYNEALEGDVLGNIALLGEENNTGEPFVMGLVGKDIYMFTSDTASTHTVAIYKVVSDG